MNKLILPAALLLAGTALFAVVNRQAPVGPGATKEAPDLASDVRAQRSPSALLGTVKVSAPQATPLAGDVFIVSFRVDPREGSPVGSISITTGPGLELLAGDRMETIALVPGQAIVRELQLRKTLEVDTSVIVTVHGTSVRRGGAWSFSGYQNFRTPEQLRLPVQTIVGANGTVLVGDR